jgi:hypothetical protein
VLAGYDPDTMPAALALDIALGCIVDLWPSTANRNAALAELLGIISRPPWPERDTWGEDTTAVAAQRAMMALAGGPAPMRKDNDE